MSMYAEDLPSRSDDDLEKELLNSEPTSRVSNLILREFQIRDRKRIDEVAARQEKSARRLEVMTVVLIVLTIILIVLEFI